LKARAAELGSVCSFGGLGKAEAGREASAGCGPAFLGFVLRFAEQTKNQVLTLGIEGAEGGALALGVWIYRRYGMDL